MSTSTEPNRDRKVRRRINPATASLEELLNHLATDPATGLSPKETERRLSASTAKPLYRAPVRSFGECVKTVSREPALWLLLAVSFVSLFFDRVLLGTVCLLAAAGNTALSAFLLRRASVTDAAMAAYDAPLCRVLRGRRICRVGAAELARGDIILFYPGDMIPADCRLLRTDGFAVSEREIDADPSRPSHRLEKDAAATPEAMGSFRLSPVNMVFAGGVCEEGFAIAAVVAVGSETHVGGLTGGLDSPRAGKRPGLFRKAGRWLSLYNLALLFPIVPITAIGIFTLGDRYELLDIFLASLAVAAVTLSEQVLAKGLLVNAALRRKAAAERDTANGADLKSAVEPEKLIEVTDLLLVGSAALHDGESHAETLRLGDRVYRLDRPEADDSARAVAELAYLYRHGLTLYPAADGEGSVSADTLLTLADSLSEWAEIDTDALLLRAKDVRAEADGISAVFPTAEGNRRVTVTVTSDFEAVKACNTRCQDGLMLPMTEECRADLYRAHREAIRTGRLTLFLLTRAGGETAARGMLTYAPHTSRKTAGAVKSLESAGIRVSLFLKDASDVDIRAAGECGLTETHPPLSLSASETSPAALLEDGRRCFTDCTSEQISDCIRELKAAGRTVAVLSVEQEDVSLLNAADVAVSCSPTLFVSAENGHPRLTSKEVSRHDTLADPDGLPNGSLATDLCRRRADLLVRRASPEGGGVIGFRRALLCADHIKDTTDRCFGYLLLSQTARLLLLLLPVLLGLALPSAPAILLSGMGIDLLILLSLIALPHPVTPRPRRSAESGITTPHITYRPELIALAAAVALPVTVAAVCRFCDVDFGGSMTHFLTLCLVGLQTVFYRASPLVRRERGVFLTTMALVLIYVAALAVALAGGLYPLWALAVPLASPALYLILRAVVGRFKGAGKP